MTDIIWPVNPPQDGDTSTDGRWTYQDPPGGAVPIGGGSGDISTMTLNPDTSITHLAGGLATTSTRVGYIESLTEPTAPYVGLEWHSLADGNHRVYVTDGVTNAWIVL